MSTTVKSRINVRTLAFVGMLTAIIFLMAFTPLGYLRTAGIDITFLMIPVALGAMLFGPGAGAFLGGVFGLTSFIQCFGLSPFGTALMGINPFFTVLTCFIPRILTGLLAGYIFRALQKNNKTRLFSYPVACLSCALFNTLLFTSCVVLFFWNTDYIQNLSETLGSGSHIFAFAVAFVSMNGVVEAICCLVIGTALVKVLPVLGRMISKK